jgi:hypothetical protein
VALQADGKGQSRDARDPALHRRTDRSARQKEAEAAIEPDVHARDDEVWPPIEEGMHAQVRAVGGVAADRKHLDPVPLQALDAYLLPAGDRLAYPAALRIGDRYADGPELLQRPHQRHERRGVDAVVVRDQDVTHTSKDSPAAAGQASGFPSVTENR